MSKCEKTKALEQALCWLEAEATNPGEAKPEEILKVIRKALGINPDETVNDSPEREEPQGSKEFVVDTPKDLYVRAHAIDDGPMDDPEFALIVIGKNLASTLNKLRKLLEDNGDVTEVRTLGSPVWRPDRDGNELYEDRVSLDELVVIQSGFWYRSAGKYGGAIETDMVRWEDLEEYIKQDGKSIYQASDMEIESPGSKLKAVVEQAWEDQTGTAED